IVYNGLAKANRVQKNANQFLYVYYTCQINSIIHSPPLANRYFNSPVSLNKSKRSLNNYAKMYPNNENPKLLFIGSFLGQSLNKEKPLPITLLSVINNYLSLK
ncbi:MAG: hypothetical protein WAS55_04050, partial [Saprospiraceae bacterium]